MKRNTWLSGIAAALIAFAAPAKADTVRVTVSFYSAATGPFFEKMAAEFTKANPGHEIKIEVVNWNALLQKLQTDISGNANSDISIIGTRWLLDFVRDDLIEPLDGYMNPAFRERFIGTFLKPAEIKNKVYGLPIAASSRGLYYNKAMLTAAGFPNGPKTWDELIAAAEKIKAAGGNGFGVQGKGTETDVYWYYSLWSHGGDVVTPDGKAAFNSPAGVKTLSMYKSIVDRGLSQPGVTDYDRTDLQNLFKQGRIGMVITAPFLINQIAKEVPTLDYGIAPVPAGTNSSTYAVTDSVVMFKNSKVKPTAWKFLDYIFTAAPRIEFTKGEGFLPTTKAEAADPYFTGNERLQTFVNLLPNAHFAPTITGWEDTAKAVTNAAQSVYLGQATPEAALKKAEEEANKALNK